MKRRQSFKQEDFKRTVYSAEMLDAHGAGAEHGADLGMERGFTEGGAGTRHV